MRTVEEHLAACLAAVSPLAPVELGLLDAVDCVLAEDVVATGSLPAFDGSAMDGYAVRHADVAGAGPAAPVSLPVVADLTAGVRDVAPLAAGAAARIMTGAPVPPGATAVVPVEDTDGGVATVLVRRAVPEGLHVRRAGEDVRPGTTLVAAGTRLSVRHVALLAAVGRERARVLPAPRVAVLSTGSELVEPGRPAGFGQVVDANSTALTAAARDVGARATRVGIVDDDPQRLMTVLEDQLEGADVIITSGGVSAGAYDVVKEVLSRLGTVEFTRVAMQPGMPQGLGVLTRGARSVPIFTLPGNPVSAYVSFEVFVRPALRRVLGEAELHRPTVVATATQGWSSPPGKRQFTRAVVTTDDDGRPRVRPASGPGSHLVHGLAGANALAVTGEDTTSVEPGDVVRCMLLERGRR
ncbi:molybdotransferase-like divisome protein Glp [Quadrisphaera sp. KR29]|uniref:molybdotransferase-like divisome protein Glp n=1 Tax=Quadrisphaera sp. KR29 TaxID=3461391 RepID=UPI004044D65B